MELVLRGPQKEERNGVAAADFLHFVTLSKFVSGNVIYGDFFMHVEWSLSEYLIVVRAGGEQECW